MNNKNIFDSYLTNQYSVSENVNFEDPKQLDVLFEKNRKVLSENMTPFLTKNIKKDGKIIDLGCGYGNFLFYLNSLGYTNVTGVDTSTEEIEICRKRFAFSKLIHSDFFDYIEKTVDKFDLIYLSHVLEHISKERLSELLQGLKKILNNDGYIIIVVPNCAAYFNGSVSRYADMTHEIGFVDKSLRQLFISNGYDNKKIIIKNYNGPVNPVFKFIRRAMMNLFEIFIQILGYEKQKVNSSSLIAIIRK